jgi:hypothetical protein
MAGANGLAPAPLVDSFMAISISTLKGRRRRRRRLTGSMAKSVPYGATTPLMAAVEAIIITSIILRSNILLSSCSPFIGTSFLCVSVLTAAIVKKGKNVCDSDGRRMNRSLLLFHYLLLPKSSHYTNRPKPAS